MRILFTVLLIAFAPLAWADDDHGHDDHGHDEEHAHSDEGSNHKATLGDVVLLHAWTPATEEAEALVFVEIDNDGDAPVTLLGAESDLAEAVELVGFQLKDGAGSYASLPKLPIAAGAKMELAPNAVAFRMSGVTQHLHQGDEFELHIEFDAGEVHMMVQVEAEGATQHSHAGHNH
ncbi:MAG: copper chaperone PCu(A)C [Pseudomonadota bacterium]